MSSIPTPVEPPHRLRDHPRALAHRHAHGAVLEHGPLVGHLGQRGDRALGVGGILEAHLEPLAADAVLELVRGALGDHVAVVDDHDPVGEAVGLLEVLRGQQHGRAGRRARLDRLPHAQPRARVQAGRRLVEEQHRRPGDERGGEVQPPAHAAGVGLGGPLGRLGELEALEQLVRARLRLLAGQVVELADHLEVLEAGQVLVDGRVLAGEPDLGPQRGRVAHDVEAGDAGAARIGLEQGGEDPHRCGLARPVGAEQAEDAPRTSREVHAAERADRPVGLLEPFDDDRIIVHCQRTYWRPAQISVRLITPSSR